MKQTRSNNTVMKILPVWGLALILSLSPGNAYLSPKTSSRQILSTSSVPIPHIQTSFSSSFSSSTTLSFSKDDIEFDRKVRLRAEAESPFVKLRYFLYLNAAGGAFTSLAISLARIAAALNGVNVDLLQESLINAAVDIAGLAVVFVLYQRDNKAEQARLQRATKGAELAKLPVRASKALVDDLEPAEGATFATTLVSLRRGRGIEKRVVMAVAGPELLSQILDDARRLQKELALNDLVLVPLLWPQGIAPDVDPKDLPSSVALPITVGPAWKDYMQDEASEAIQQGVNIEEEGMGIIMKKNGRVGQRTKGVFLDTLVGNVIARREAGMDVTNI